ncbi:MAG: DUF2520 domain-containing protein [Actinomycetaceae bacterium]|nr:DUF2520 domain-containing protein [Actinomycetaceae bacterium]
MSTDSRSQAAPRAGRLRIGVISAGKVGAALGAALRANGHTITGAYASSDASRDRLDAMLPQVPALSAQEIAAVSDVVLFAVPDDELPPLVSGLAKVGAFRPGQLLIHVAGRYGIAVLEPARAAGALALAIHPAMTFTGTSLDLNRLNGCPFAVTGPATLLPVGQALVTEMGGVPFTVAEEDRGLYHAAIAHGANHLVTLVAQAMRALAAVGIDNPGEYLRPLVEASLDGALRSGENLLTGPVVRGDVGTVAEHAEAFRALAATGDFADIPPVYRELATATAQRAGARRVLRPEQVGAIERAAARATGEVPGVASS